MWEEEEEDNNLGDILLIGYVSVIVIILLKIRIVLSVKLVKQKDLLRI